jgi:photosystem II biogenesis protein Psp29
MTAISRTLQMRTAPTHMVSAQISRPAARVVCAPRSSAQTQLLARTRPALRVSCSATRVLVSARSPPPTVADTKAKFLAAYTKPISALYNTVIQEFLVQSHLCRVNVNYEYDAIIGMGFVSVFDQVTDGMGAQEQQAIFKAYVEALGDDPVQYRADAEKMCELASSSSAEDLKPDANGNELQKALAKVADKKKYYYTKWFGVGLFRMLELSGATEPKALETLVTSLGIKTETVNRDLLMYKGVLSKMTSAKELMAEMMAREKKKQAEREAEKAKDAEASPAMAKS